MVDYRGPQIARGLVDAWQLPFFQRVVSIGYMHRDTDKVQLERKDFVALQKLEQVWMANSVDRDATEKTTNDLKGIVPPCRLSSVEATPTRISAQLNTNAFGCSP